MNTLTDELVIELEDFDVPSSIGVNSIAINVDDSQDNIGDLDTINDNDAKNPDRTTIPEDVSVSGEKIFITIGDLNKDRTGGGGAGEAADFDISENSVIHIVIRQSAGVSNPTEFGTFGPAVEIVTSDTNRTLVDVTFDDDEDAPKYQAGLRLPIYRILDLDEEDGGLGTVVNATGKGFKNSTSLTVFVDNREPVMWDDDQDNGTSMVRVMPSQMAEYNADVMADPDDGNTPYIPDDDDDIYETYTYDETTYISAPNGELDLSEDVLCVVSSISGDDTGSCEFKITHPTFDGGINLINAVDGRSGYVGKRGNNDPASLDFLAKFELEASLSANPSEGSPGEILLIQVVDFTANSSINKVTLARQIFCSDTERNAVGDQVSCPGAIDAQGSGNFKIVIPNWARAGVQELKVFSDRKDDAATNVTIGGPRITVTPETVLANQRISLVGTGFSSNAYIARAPSSEDQVAKISVGGQELGWGRINDGDPVEIDSGGNWSSSVDLPLSGATTAEGERVIRITDSDGRTGAIIVDVPAREVKITPDVGRVGTIAVVRGTGFPSKNDEGTSFNVEIEYDAGNDKTTTVSAVPDASGRFEIQLRIPTTASIPSTNTVKVSFEDEDDVAVVTTVAHEVPEGIINLSETSGGPGSTVTVSGEGFKSFVPISLVKVGTLDVTPAPKPSTDGNGMMSFDVIVPGLDVGIQTIEVNVGDTTSSTGFTVTESGVNPGDIKEIAPALEGLGDNFVNIWHFNNDTKAWSFYDAQEGSDLTHLITGETYLMQIKSTVEVILNGDTRNLTCVGGNCWNQIVW